MYYTYLVYIYVYMQSVGKLTILEKLKLSSDIGSITIKAKIEHSGK